MIPMVDLTAQYPLIREEIERELSKVLDGAQFILGPNVQAFEQETADYLGVKHAVACASGTDALHLALRAAGIGAGDEVITSPFTFIATAEAIRYVGATPVFVDIEPDTMNLDPDLVRQAITERTRAILPVHLFGHPAEITPLQQLAYDNGLLLIEDCAQSFGATVDGVQTGAFGIAGCHSFFPSKNLGCYGDGGLVSTNSDAIAEELKVYRNHGSRERYYHHVIGYNSRLDEMQAVILRAKLRHIDSFNAGRRRAAHAYSEALGELPGVVVPSERPGMQHVYHQYTLLSDRRDTILAALREKQIGCAVYYPVPLHQQEVFKEDCKGQMLSVTEDIARRCMSLPIFPELNDAQIDEVTSTVKSVF
ncbi:DegT/DnrJ/EryC1/StrS family aminotransferase [Methylonatrum kenyense]|uniref:DegT/DnrJ/EryC1/StrS family aminotransferase n=1 Tax=Methylonatrum kenyense TaxID=455253 RepID=UPI0020BF8910|nr:DegT/DnrJ/EryC1/StrS family aminotransferase [Methylonatrum kenyense]MCK8516390.1 DegT/DnrJ/EryC1/StrS family aminotransferase [Methylonatrum kenyense]